MSGMSAAKSLKFSSTNTIQKFMFGKGNKKNDESMALSASGFTDKFKNSSNMRKSSLKRRTSDKKKNE